MVINQCGPHRKDRAYGREPRRHSWATATSDKHRGSQPGSGLAFRWIDAANGMTNSAPAITGIRNSRSVKKTRARNSTLANFSSSVRRHPERWIVLNDIPGALQHEFHHTPGVAEHGPATNKTARNDQYRESGAVLRLDPRLNTQYPPLALSISNSLD
jgi:hypothetical protein